MLGLSLVCVLYLRENIFKHYSLAIRLLSQRFKSSSIHLKSMAAVSFNYSPRRSSYLAKKATFRSQECLSCLKSLKEFARVACSRVLCASGLVRGFTQHPFSERCEISLILFNKIKSNLIRGDSIARKTGKAVFFAELTASSPIRNVVVVAGHL